MTRAASQGIAATYLPLIRVSPVLRGRQRTIGSEAEYAGQPGHAAVTHHAERRADGEPESSPDHRGPAN
jgi:hypothetical protein